MNVSLTPELERYVQAKVASGMYNSASEVVREGLRLLVEREVLHASRLGEVRQKVALGLADARAGKFVDGSKAYKKLQQRIGRRGGGKRT